MRYRAAPCPRGPGRRHIRDRRGRRRSRCQEGGGGLLGVCLRPRRQEFPTPESASPYANDTLYGAAKTFNEGLLRSFHAMRGLDYVALRYFNVYGPRMDIHGLYTEVLIRWMERIEAGQPPLILGDGSQTMDFVFTEDIARANLLAATSDATDEVFNIGSGTETSLTELAQVLLGAMGSDLPLEYGPPRGVNAVTRRLADVSLAENGWGGARRSAWKKA